MKCSRLNCKEPPPYAYPLIKMYHPLCKVPAQCTPELPHCKRHQDEEESKDLLRELAWLFVVRMKLQLPTRTDIIWTTTWIGNDL